MSTFNPGKGPYNYPQITINEPITPGPQQLTTAGSNPTIFGVIDGTNNLFSWGVTFQRIQYFRNGIEQTINVDFAGNSTALVCLPVSIPQPGDVLTIYGW